MGKEEVAITLPENLDNLDLPVIHVEIVEQPSENGFRFRYQSEGKNIGCLHGQTSNGPYRTYPKIKIVGYEVKKDFDDMMTSTTLTTLTSLMTFMNFTTDDSNASKYENDTVIFFSITG